MFDFSTAQCLGCSARRRRRLSVCRAPSAAAQRVSCLAHYLQRSLPCTTPASQPNRCTETAKRDSTKLEPRGGLVAIGNRSRPGGKPIDRIRPHVLQQSWAARFFPSFPYVSHFFFVRASFERYRCQGRARPALFAGRRRVDEAAPGAGNIMHAHATAEVRPAACLPACLRVRAMPSIPMRVSVRSKVRRWALGSPFVPAQKRRGLSVASQFMRPE